MCDFILFLQVENIVWSTAWLRIGEFYDKGRVCSYNKGELAVEMVFVYMCIYRVSNGKNSNEGFVKTKSLKKLKNSRDN